MRERPGVVGDQPDSDDCELIGSILPNTNADKLREACNLNCPKSMLLNNPPTPPNLCNHRKLGDTDDSGSQNSATRSQSQPTPTTRSQQS